MKPCDQQGKNPVYQGERGGEAMEDREILELFRQRDQRAIPALEERYGGRLRALSLRLLGSPEDAEECVSDTYLAAWNAIPPEEPVYLFAYLSAICRNRALRAGRRPKSAGGRWWP